MRKVKLFTIVVHLFVALTAILAWSCAKDEAGRNENLQEIDLQLTKNQE